MRFLSIYKSEETNQPPTLEHVTRMQQLIEEGMKGGWLISTEGCLPSAKGARVRRANGKTTVTDGPFTESKELVAGFAILEAASKQHAIELTERFLAVAGGGECEVRQVFTASDEAPAHAVETHAQLVEQMVKGRGRPVQKDRPYRFILSAREG
jgi:hypothetical protein